MVKVIVVAVLLLLLSACSQEHIYYDSNGKQVLFSQLQGRWVIINYWATWCKPCYEEIPQLNAFYAEHRNGDIVLLGVNYDHAAPEELPDLIDKMDAEFPMLTEDPARQLGVKHISGLPTTLIIGPDGGLKKILLGEQTQEGLDLEIDTLRKQP